MSLREDRKGPSAVGSLRDDIDEKRPFRIDLEQAFKRLLSAPESRHSKTSLVGYCHLF